MEDSALFTLHWDGTEYTLTTDDLTVNRLRLFKRLFGPEYGKYLPFMQMLASADADAVACALWTVRKKAGEKGLPEPHMMDFPVWEVFIADAQEDAEEDPTNEPPEKEPTEPATETDTEGDQPGQTPG